MKLLHIVGNRPQFIKLAPFLRETRKMGGIRDVLVHSGQHYDYEMSKIFLDELGIPGPDYNLGVGSGTHGQQTGTVLAGLDGILIKESPDCVLVYGDTNTTLAGALAAYKLHYPLCHVESGLREKVWRPEEINRKLSDHCANYLFCPTETAVKCLREEGIEEDRIFNTGDITYDAFLWSCRKLERENKLKPSSKDHILITLHRAETVDYKELMAGIADVILSFDEKVVFPVHPRTIKFLEKYDLAGKLRAKPNVHLGPPVGYFEFLRLLLGAKLVITDSGGVIKESFYAGKKCVTLDHTTEYKEIFESGTHVLAGKDKKNVCGAIEEMLDKYCNPVTTAKDIFGNGDAAKKMVKIIREGLKC